MEILLSSEAFIKSVTSISDNVAGKYILPSLREAQEVGLRGILGDCLTDRLKGMVSDGTIGEEEGRPYRDLLDRCQYYLAYSALVEVAQKVSFKLTNFGVARTRDDNVEQADTEGLDRTQQYYQDKADSCCLAIQRWLLDNRDQFPELDDCDCDRLKANLRSAASCGIWLGGPRGRIIRGGGC